MLFSESASLGFAHFPKTGGHSLGAWFKKTFPDSYFLERPQNGHMVSHMDCNSSLCRLRESFNITMPAIQASKKLETVRILGVVREPLDVLISLYEYWRSYPFKSAPKEHLIERAREDSFGDFLRWALVARELPNYEEFFDVGGPAWDRTYLIDFEALELGLREACRLIGFYPPAEPFSTLNPGPKKHRAFHSYAREAQPLLGALRSRFCWYYEEGRSRLLRGGSETA